MSDQTKWGIGLMLTVLLSVTGATWVIASSIADVRERVAAVEVRLEHVEDGITQLVARVRSVEDDVTWLRNNHRGDR